MAEKKEIILYTDGGCRGNQDTNNIGAIGGILMFPKTGAVKEYNVGFRNTTNNKMEILAVLTGLKMLKEPCIVKVHSDSAYVVNAVEKGWLKGWKAKGWTRGKAGELKNKELWQEMDRLLAEHDVTFVKVKGHANDKWNNRADALVNQAMDELKQK